MPERPVVFISCGQSTPDELALGSKIEQFIREETAFEPYFAEQQNTLEGLAANILSWLHRASAFIGIMHHRGTIQTPNGDQVVRGSVWVEQELAICSFMQHVLNRQLEVALYLQRGISREGIRSQLRLKPVEFDTDLDVLADLKQRVPGWQLKAVPDAPLVARWNSKLQPGYTGARHNYTFSVALCNKSNERIDEWKIELWFPSFLVENSSGSERFVYKSDSYTNHSADEKVIWPEGTLNVFTIPFVVTDHNWPGYRDNQKSVPKVRIKVSTANAPPWEKEIAAMDIMKF